MKKGLRRLSLAIPLLALTLKPCPDEEGIKTLLDAWNKFEGYTLKPCPDEEGIKTPALTRILAETAFKTLP